MSSGLSLDQVIQALTGRSSRDESGEQGRLAPGVYSAAIHETVVDSRQCRPGSLFVALRGEKVDGHLYVADAFARGAVAALVERPVGDGAVLDLRDQRPAQENGHKPASQPLPVCLVVEDALAALQKLASWWRVQVARVARHAPRVIGITGSLGKTTTKEYVASVLEQRYHVLKSQGNQNNEIGLPLTLLQMEAGHDRLVLEMGTYGLGEITLLARIAQPDIGIVTNVGPVHLERMGTIERIAQAKAELPQALPPNGVAILNGDDERVRAMAQQTRARVFLYGLTPQCDLWADQVESKGLDGLRFCFHYGGESVHADAPLLGRHNVYTALRAAAVGLVEGLPWGEILNGLRAGERLRLVAVPGVNDSTLLDDTYNSSPDSAVAALDLLGELSGRKIAVLGDMLELGEYTAEGHCRVGHRAVGVVSWLVTVGELGRLIGEGALAYGMAPERVVHAENNEQAISRLQSLIQPGDQVLIKGSRGVSMEQVVRALVRPRADGPAGVSETGAKGE